LCTSEDFEGRHVIQLETGCGKTALCFTIACHFAKKGMKALIINESEELTFRDYKKALETSNNLNLLMNIVQRE
jgi:superfamily II DNA or RNA helicase